MPAKKEAPKKPAEKKSAPVPASKSAHDKLRSEFDEFKDVVSAKLGIDPNAPEPGTETDVARLEVEAAQARLDEANARLADSA